MSVERLISGQNLTPEEEQLNFSLRPSKLDEYIGQKEMVKKLRVSLEAARARKEPFEHALLSGPRAWARPRSRM